MLTPTVNYAMCTIKLHKGVIEGVDRIRKQCLWRGNSARKKGGNLVAWPMVQRPKKKGGLGIKNLYLQNYALLMKQLHKFYSKEDIPWVPPKKISPGFSKFGTNIMLIGSLILREVLVPSGGRMSLG